jgi:hypothetical protein
MEVLESLFEKALKLESPWRITNDKAQSSNEVQMTRVKGNNLAF